jgi:hypothetical protein
LPLVDCLKDHDPNDIEKIVNITSTLGLTFSAMTRTTLLLSLKEVEDYVEKNHYEKLYLFWKGTKENGLGDPLYIPNDLYRKMFFTLFHTEKNKLEKYVLSPLIREKISEERKKSSEEEIIPAFKL